MLRASSRDGALRALLREHILRDSNGRPLTNPGFSVQAKTGTLYFVSALGGYLRTASGRDLAFAICSADLPRRARVAGTDLDQPEGTSAWNGQARQMQQDLLRRWAQVHA
jgi:D-alanyl-D-alanine carboxypeptidase/D-alanyl-D-alanine-endopeptidase (penicillin-binding protein 4)